MRPAPRVLGLATAVLAGAVAVAPRALGSPILPAPTASSTGAELATLAAGFQLQQDVFATAENGLTLDVYFNAASVPVVRAFFAQSATTSFVQATGMQPFSVVETFQEWGDEGNFAGISSVGVAARLMELERDGGSQVEIASARAAAVAAAQAWHVYGAIAGPGFLARGVRRTQPLGAGEPPLPGGPAPATTPLFDAQGNPQPTPKVSVWRAPVAAGYTDWIWFDDTSKDQVSGYALAVAWLWDALQGDPNVAPDVTANLVTDLVAFVKELQKVAPETGVDLCIRDADGRLTGSFDLNPRILVPGGDPAPLTSTLRNGFNAAMALGVVTAAYHVSGDPEIGQYLYDDLVGTRDFPSEMAENAGILIFEGPQTNFSNVNMLAIALASIGRFETDPYVRSKLAATLQTQFWSTGDSADVSHDEQAWFDVLYGAYAPGVTTDITARMEADLGAFQAAPAIERTRNNCDDAGIASGVCVGIDGKTVFHVDTQGGHGGELVATTIVPMALRPDSDMEWRSSPFQLNGTGSTLMDPRGDWLTAYWLGRLYDTDVSLNLTPDPRAPLPYSFADAGDAAASPTDAGADAAPAVATTPSGGKGCGCDVAPDLGLAWGAGSAAMVSALALGRRRKRKGSGHRARDHAAG